MERGALGGYSPWAHKESDMTEQLSTPHTLIRLATYISFIKCLFIFPHFYIICFYMFWAVILTYSGYKFFLVMYFDKYFFPDLVVCLFTMSFNKKFFNLMYLNILILSFRLELGSFPSRMCSPMLSWKFCLQQVICLHRNDLFCIHEKQNSKFILCI